MIFFGIPNSVPQFVVSAKEKVVKVPVLVRVNLFVSSLKVKTIFASMKQVRALRTGNNSSIS
jgi:hypothetical protein